MYETEKGDQLNETTVVKEKLRKSRKQVAMAFKWINGTTSDTKLLLAYWRLRVRQE
jgi:hypothetical protein